MVVNGILDQELEDKGFSVDEVDDDFVEILLKGARIGRGVFLCSTSPWLTRENINHTVRAVIDKLTVQKVDGDLRHIESEAKQRCHIVAYAATKR